MKVEEVANNLSEIISEVHKMDDGQYCTEPIAVDRMTLVWAEYWIRWAMKNCIKE